MIDIDFLETLRRQDMTNNKITEITHGSTVIGTLGVAMHTSRTVDETEGLNCDLKRLEAKPQTTKQHQQHALVVF